MQTKESKLGPTLVGEAFSIGNVGEQGKFSRTVEVAYATVADAAAYIYMQHINKGGHVSYWWGWCLTSLRTREKHACTRSRYGKKQMRSVITRERNGAGAVVYEHRETTRFLKNPKYAGPWEVMMMFSGEGVNELDARLADHSLGMQAVRVLFAMLKSVEIHDGNRVRAGRKDLARMLGMNEANVGKAIRQLIDCGFVEQPKLKFSPYVISPRFAWYGRTEDLRCALRDRSMLDEKTGMMAAKRAA